MSIPREYLEKFARKMGEQARRDRVTRRQAETYILGFVRTWAIVYRASAQVEPGTMRAAIRAFQIGRNARFSAEPRPMLALRMNAPGKRAA